MTGKCSGSYRDCGAGDRSSSAARLGFPAAPDVLLVVEVAESSLEHDRQLKLPAYAQAAIPECWIVNLPAQHVEVYREPAGGEYRLVRICRTGETLEPLAYPGVALTVADVLGQPDAHGEPG